MTTASSAARQSTLAVPLRTAGGAKAAPRKAPSLRAPLRLVPQRRSNAARMPFVLVVVAILGGGLLGLLLLNTLVAQGSFALHDLSSQSKVLQQHEQDLAKQVENLQSPATLAARASALGMVPGGPPAFLQLPSGKVLGRPMPGVAPPAASTTWTAPRPTTPPSQAAKPGTPATAAKPGSKPAAQPRTTPATPGAHR